MKESSFWSELRPRLPRGHYTRLESEISPGVFDVSFCVEGIEGFLELKYQRRLSGSLGLRHGLRTTQLRWAEARLAHGGLLLAAVGVGSNFYLFRGPALLTLNDLPYKDYPQGVRLRDGPGVQNFFKKILQTPENPV